MYNCFQTHKSTLQSRYSLALTDAGVNSDWQLGSKDDAVFLASPVKNKTIGE